MAHVTKRLIVTSKITLGPLPAMSVPIFCQPHRLVSGAVKQKRVSRAKALRKEFTEAVRGDADRSYQYRNDEDNMDVLYGVHPVQAALTSAHRAFDRESALYVRSSLYKRLYESSDMPSMPSTTEVSVGELYRLSSTKVTVDAAIRLGIQVIPVHKSKLDQLSQYAVHQGVCLKVGKLLIPEIQTGSQLSAFTNPLSQHRSAKFALLLDSVQDPMNMGGMIRSAAFLGVSPLLLSPACCSITPVVSKASAGAAETMPIFKLTDVSSVVRKLLNDDWSVIGSSSQSEESTQISDLAIDKNRNTLLVLGSEGSGLKPEVESLCTQRAFIPPGENLPENLDSLNVSVAAGILMHHIKACLG